MPWAVGLGAAAGGILATVILFFVLLHREQSSRTRADDRADNADAKLEAATKVVDDLKEKNEILDHNNGELLKERADLQTSIQATEAELASVKASRDDLLRALESHPGTLPPALVAELDRLRAQVPAPADAASAGDPHGGEAGPVHAPGDELEHP